MNNNDFLAVLLAVSLTFGVGFALGASTATVGQVGDASQPTDDEAARVHCSLTAENDSPMAVCFKSGDVNVTMNLAGPSTTGNVTLTHIRGGEVNQ